MEFDALKQMPHSLEAEQSVIGALIIDPAVMDKIAGFLKPEHFYHDKYGKVYETILFMSLDNEQIDFVTVLEKVRMAGIYEEEEGKQVLYNLAQSVPTSANAAAYARIIEQKAKLRQLIQACEDISAAAYAQGEEVGTILDMAESRIYEIMQSRTNTELTHIRQAILSTYDNLAELARNQGKYQGLPTRFSSLDNYLLGLGKSDLVLIAARPGMGKTAFALNIAENIGLKEKKTIAVFSLEMSNEQLVNRMLSSHSGVMNTKFRKGDLVDNEWIRLNQSAEILSKTNIYLDDTPGITVPQIKAKLRRLKNVDLVIIDYLQLMESAKKTDGRTQEVSEISRSLKLMAKEFEIPVITLSQLSRGPESRPDKRPQMSDLRESGAIEQDADIIMLLYRDDYYNKENSEHPGVCECIIAKNRHGSTGTIELAWSGENTRFSDLDVHHD